MYVEVYSLFVPRSVTPFREGVYLGYTNVALRRRNDVSATHG